MAEIVWMRDPARGFEIAQAAKKMALLDFASAPK